MSQGLGKRRRVSALGTDLSRAVVAMRVGLHVPDDLVAEELRDL